jgi:hypothetical protein
MIQKIFVTILLITVFLFSLRFLKKLTFLKSQKNKKEEEVIDLEKDPKTNEYRPKK